MCYTHFGNGVCNVTIFTTYVLLDFPNDGYKVKTHCSALATKLVQS